jgi:F-type H+-transporting ATPase subunit delta
MLNVSIPRRYARALLAATAEKSNSDSVLAQLDAIAQAFRESPVLAEVVTHPGYARSDRAAAIEVLIRVAGSLDRVVSNLLRLLAERERLAYLPDIARIFRDMVDSRAGRLRGSLTTAVPVAEPVVQKLETNLGQLTQRRVVLESRVDPSLLGGAAAQVGSTLYDGSLKSQLEELRQNLKRS